MSSRVLITGASGFVGMAVAEAFGKAGWRVVCVVRKIQGCPILEGVEWVELGNIDAMTDWGRLLQGVDLVIHLAARVHYISNSGSSGDAEWEADVKGTLKLTEVAARDGVGRFIYLSSIGVNGNQTFSGKPFSGSDAVAPVGGYAKSKWRCECIVKEVCVREGMEYVIIRPPIVYGPGVKANFYRLMQWVDRGVPLPFASVKNSRSMIYIGNLVDALLLCSSHPDSRNQLFLVRDGQDFSTPGLIEYLSMSMEKKTRLFRVPVAMLRFMAFISNKTYEFNRLLGSLEIDDSVIRKRLGWVPPFSVNEGARITAQWFLRRK